MSGPQAWAWALAEAAKDCPAHVERGCGTCLVIAGALERVRAQGAMDGLCGPLREQMPNLARRLDIIAAQAAMPVPGPGARLAAAVNGFGGSAFAAALTVKEVDGARLVLAREDMERPMYAEASTWHRLFVIVPGDLPPGRDALWAWLDEMDAVWMAGRRELDDPQPRTRP